MKRTRSRLIIGPASASDLRPVMQLAWKTTDRLYPAPFFEAIEREQGEYFRVVRKTPTGRVVGFIVAARRPGVRRNILLLAIDPSMAGQGIRRVLLADVQHVLRREGAREFEAEAPLDETGLLEFYHRQGFHVIGFEGAADQAWQDRALLTKEL